MVNITHKNNTLRTAVATAIVQVSRQETIRAIEERKVPKGDVFEFARAAGLLAVKKTSDVIPDCHPLPVEYTAITYHTEGLEVHIRVEVHTIYKTGVEVEAMHGASVTALVMYDMLKPIDKGVEIRQVRLLEKKGGKTDLKGQDHSLLEAAVVVCSDRVSRQEATDTAGPVLIAALKESGIDCRHYVVLPDEIQAIQDQAKALAAAGADLILFCGGTGLSPRDVTPEAVMPLIDRAIPGIMETARSYGQQRIGTAMLSRGIAGFIGNTLVLTLPGSAGAAREYMAALFPQVLHVLSVRDGAGH